MALEDTLATEFGHFLTALGKTLVNVRDSVTSLCPFSDILGCYVFVCFCCVGPCAYLTHVEHISQCVNEALLRPSLPTMISSTTLVLSCLGRHLPLLPRAFVCFFLFSPIPAWLFFPFSAHPIAHMHSIPLPFPHVASAHVSPTFCLFSRSLLLHSPSLSPHSEPADLTEARLLSHPASASVLQSALFSS